MRIAIPILFLLFTAFGTSVSAENRTLRFTTGDWPPFIFQRDGSVDPVRPGFSIEIVNAVLREMGYDLTYESLPFLRQIAETEQGTFDAMVVLYQSEAPNLLFPNEAIGTSQNCFFARPESGWTYDGPNSLLKIKLAVVEGYIYGEIDDIIHANKDNTLSILGDELDMMGRLSRLVTIGRADAFIQDREVAGHYFNTAGTGANFKIVGCLKEIHVEIGFSPSKETSKALIKSFDETLRDLRASGEIGQILKKYNIEDWK